MPRLDKNKTKPQVSAATPRRTRLSPLERQQSILDHTANIVTSEGISAVSMERVGREAGISKSLVYVYFPSQTDLLRALLIRELKTLRLRQKAAAESAKTFEQVVRNVTHVYLAYIKERGLLLQRLQHEPSLAKGQANPTDYGRDSAVHFLAQMVAQYFDLPLKIAKPATDISFGLPATAGQYWDRHDIAFEVLEDLTITMILGSVQAVADRYREQD